MPATPRTSQERKLEIKFHGRVIEHLGIDMYQSAVAAIAELVSNAWDAEATKVDVQLPTTLGTRATIVIHDDGDGMTFEECQHRFLQVGYNRRSPAGSDKTRSGRPVMGRKGIGKFAGFGIASVMQIETVSRETGELTIFRLDVAKLLSSSDGSYIDNTPMKVEVVKYQGPDKRRTKRHGTVVTLSGLTIKQKPSEAVFARSMGRRFLLLERAAGFQVTVNGKHFEQDSDKALIEFDFPKDWPKESLPEETAVVDGWGEESVAGHKIRWRFLFYKETIGDEELAGVAIFSHGKLAQKPFYFALSGGLGGQQALPYLTGSVEADFIDEQAADLISTERQRINWENAAAQPLLKWGQKRVKALLRIWQQKRSESKVKAMEERMAGFSARLDKLPAHERSIVKRALTAIARISVLSDDDFDTLGDSILQAWEGGRLHDLIATMASADSMDAETLVELLAQNNVMTALHAAERVKSQLNLILGLEDRIKAEQLENAVRDYIAENPWLISPEWDTFKVERSVTHLVADALKEADIAGHDDWNARVDLCLASGSHLLVLEFMRPGVTADWDHLNRFERYVRILREKVEANTTTFQRVSGILVADRLERKTGMRDQLKSMRRDDMDALDWKTLLAQAEAKWLEYFEILRLRAPGDERMKALAEASRSITSRPSRRKRSTPTKTTAKKSAATPTKKAATKSVATPTKKAATKSAATPTKKTAEKKVRSTTTGSRKRT